jgi:hypothetical protein
MADTKKQKKPAKKATLKVHSEEQRKAPFTPENGRR